MVKRQILPLALLPLVLAAAPSMAQVGAAGSPRPSTRPATTRAASTTPAVVAPAVPIVAPKTFPALPPDPIERADFMSKPKTIAKSITSATAMMVIMSADKSEVGVTADVIASVAAGSRQGTAFSAVFVSKQAKVGPEMTTSFDEAVRAVGMRYPKIDPGKIEFSFGDKYTPHEGGSAGTCFAVMLLSELEGFEIDPKVAVTGDITVDWKVRKIGGLPDKVRGAAADKCLYTGVPLENREQICDMVLFYGDSTIRDIQVFSLDTLQDAVALMRKDRAPQLTEAMKELSDLAPKLKGGRGTFALPANQKVLENIVALAPNCESAKMMLEMSKGAFPRTLSPLFAFEQVFSTLDPYIGIVLGRTPVTRQSVTLAKTTAARNQLTKLAPITPPELQPIIADIRAFVDVSENIAVGQTKPELLEPRRKTLIDHIQILGTNKDFRDRLMRSGM